MAIITCEFTRLASARTFRSVRLATTLRENRAAACMTKVPGGNPLHYAILIADVTEAGQSTSSVIAILIDTVSLPIRLFVSLVLSAPVTFIFVTLLKKSAWLRATVSNSA